MATKIQVTGVSLSADLQSAEIVLDGGALISIILPPEGGRWMKGTLFDECKTLPRANGMICINDAQGSTGGGGARWFEPTNVAGVWRMRPYSDAFASVVSAFMDRKRAHVWI